MTATTWTTVIRATATTVTSSTSLKAQPARGRKAPAVLLSLALLALVVPGTSSANDRTLKRSVAKWSHTVALDARGISLSASLRHPRRMMIRARAFRADSLRALRAIRAQKPASARGRRGKRLALGAFADYSLVGFEWARSGQARLKGQNQAASRHAARARSYARAGNRLIRSAGRSLQ